jgi:hypothetical protein
MFNATLGHYQAQLKEEFVKLVGARGTKPVLVQFMRRYVELGGKGVTVYSSARLASASSDPAVAPRSDHERAIIQATLTLEREAVYFEISLFIMLLKCLPRDYGFPAQFKIFRLVGRGFLTFDVMGNSEAQRVIVFSHLVRG